MVKSLKTLPRDTNEITLSILLPNSVFISHGSSNNQLNSIVTLNLFLWRCIHKLIQSPAFSMEKKIYRNYQKRPIIVNGFKKPHGRMNNRSFLFPSFLNFPLLCVCNPFYTQLWSKLSLAICQFEMSYKMNRFFL